MYKEGDEYQKFFSLEPEKQMRIINAATKEFLVGFKKASTDVIVREAGISKGLLFHYFGTKEKLYKFLIDYLESIIRTEYFDMINVFQKDIFDTIWQMSLLKQAICRRFPAIFQFMAGVYVETKDNPVNEHLLKFRKIQKQRLTDIYKNCDVTMFKDGVDPQKAINIVRWAMMGWADTHVDLLVPETAADTMLENYNTYLEESREYLDIFRKCFYKEG